MAETISNVLVGVATLSLGHSPTGAKAEWSDEQAYVGSYSAKLSKPAIDGSYGSTHVQFTASTNAAVQTLADFQAQTLQWGYAHFREILGEVAYWEGMELRFEDPNSSSWVDVTTTAATVDGTGVWVDRDLDAAVDTAYFGGWTELDGSFSDYTPQLISGISDDVILTAPNQSAVTACSTWLLTRVRLELWETVWDRYVFIDSVVIDGTVYAIEPGAATVALTLSAPSTEVGYTEDGVTMTYTADSADIEVEEETFAIGRALTKETVEVTCNMAEASLYNMDIAMAGSLLSGSILKLGAGTNKKMELILTGTNPAGFHRQITIPSCTATGAVGMPYKKGEKTVVPVSFQALKTTDAAAVTVVDNAA